MARNRILSILGVLFLINFISVDGAIYEGVKLRTCCDLNPRLGKKKCDENKKLISGLDSNGQVFEIPSHLMSTEEDERFPFKSEQLKCSGGMGNLTTYSKNEADPIKFYPSGYLEIMLGPGYAEYYHTSQYCINGFEENTIEIQTCNRRCSSDEPCIRKCCPPDLLYTKYDVLKRGSCSDPGKLKWTPKFFKNTKTPLSEKQLKKIQPWYTWNHPMSWVDNCLNGSLHILPFHKDVGNALLINDSIRHRFIYGEGIKLWNHLARKWDTFDKEDFCSDGILYRPGVSYGHNEDETFIMACPHKFEKNQERDPSLYYGIFASCTCGFALATVVVYFLLPEKQNIHSWTIMSHSTSIFFFFIFIATAHFTKNDAETRKTFGCLFIATMAHYFFISSFSWMALISFDLWLTFRNLTLSKGKGVKKFLGYSLFGWGVPLFIVCLSWGLELAYKDDDQSEVTIPMYGEGMCYLTTYAFWEYIYAPCTILMSLNIIFFAMTTWKLYEFQKSTSYSLFVKLFFVVGILWIFEIISWAVDKTESKLHWQILDSLNCLSPVAIFFIFVFKYDVISSLSSKYPVMKIICMPNMRILEYFRGRQSRSNDESAALNMSKTHETNVSKFSEHSDAEHGKM